MDGINWILILNTLLNMAGVIGVVGAALLIMDYRSRINRRHDVLNRRLDHILILTNELYQDALKHKRLKPDRETKDLIRRVKNQADQMRKETKNGT